jgi:hypothetical protein
MKKILLITVLAMSNFIFKAQELITNGNFSSAGFSPWSVTANSANLNAWFGPGYCGQTTNNGYYWVGDQSEQTGIDNAIEGMYQQISIPANSSTVTLSFRVSISTLESNATPYDFLKINLLNSSGAFLQTLWSLDNSYGNYGIPGCGTWFVLSSSIPSTYFGQTVRLAFEATTDVTLPTIFRVDDVSVIASTQAPSCTYSLSSNNYTCTNASANTYNNVVLVNTQNGCTWNATVLSGGSWLTTSSAGNGSGGINIIVSENTNPSPRSGIVSVGDQSFTVTQPGADCTYSLNINNYVCPNSMAATLNSIALVNTQSNCTWSAVVTSGNAWMTCSSSGSGSGTINIIVLENTTSTPRTGTIAIQGQTLTITQPAGSGNSVEQTNIEALSIYPNPSSNIVHLANSSGVKNLMFFDATGRQIHPKIDQSNNIIIADFSEYPAGMVIIKDIISNNIKKVNIVK